MMIKSVNLALRFGLEIMALIALGHWGFSSEKGWGLKLLFGLGAPILAAVLWANFGAPGASHRLTGWARILFELAVFGSAAAGLFLVGQKQLALVFAGLVVLNEGLLFLWGQW